MINAHFSPSTNSPRPPNSRAIRRRTMTRPMWSYLLDHAPARRAVDDDVVAMAKTAPAAPENQREQDAKATDDHEDHADGVDVEPAAVLYVHCERENGSNCKQEQTETHTHVGGSLCDYVTGP